MIVPSKYSNPKYLRVITALDELGFKGCKFLGDQGYYIPDNTQQDLCKLICTDPDKGFFLNIRGGHAYTTSVVRYINSIMSLQNIADQLNMILADATNTSSMNKHVSESIDSEFIQSGNPNFGAPGTYIVYRNGLDTTKRGLISFADTYQGADKYKSADNPLPTKRYLVKVSNPLVVSAQTSVVAMSRAYAQLTGKPIDFTDPSKNIIQMWRTADSVMAEELRKQGYDSLIYLIPNRNEVLVVGNSIPDTPSITEYTESATALV